MSDRLERIQAIIPQIVADKAKSAALETVVPAMLGQAMQLANGDYNKAREAAANATPIAEYLPARPWAVNMVTQPGDLVLDPAGKYTYIYSGPAAMTHGNSTYFPGANGVYYWAIIPEMHEDIKVFPNLSGIIVYVQTNEIWWNSGKTKKYEWTSGAYQCPANYYPGAAGVYQWAEVTT